MLVYSVLSFVFSTSQRFLSNSCRFFFFVIFFFFYLVIHILSVLFYYLLFSISFLPNSCLFVLLSLFLEYPPILLCLPFRRIGFLSNSASDTFYTWFLRIQQHTLDLSRFGSKQTPYFRLSFIVAYLLGILIKYDNACFSINVGVFIDEFDLASFIEYGKYGKRQQKCCWMETSRTSIAPRIYEIPYQSNIVFFAITGGWISYYKISRLYNYHPDFSKLGGTLYYRPNRYSKYRIYDPTDSHRGASATYGRAIICLYLYRSILPNFRCSSRVGFVVGRLLFTAAGREIVRRGDKINFECNVFSNTVTITGVKLKLMVRRAM